MDMVDVDSDKWAQYATAATISVLDRVQGGAGPARLRAQACEQSDCVLVATEREAQLARQIAPAARVHVVPIGIDTAVFAPAEPLPPPEHHRALIFTGDMSYFPNRRVPSSSAAKCSR